MPNTLSQISHASPVPVERIDSAILLVRGEKVLLDRNLAILYGTTTRLVNQAVRRNRDRFPPDFLFELTRDEIRCLSQFMADPKMKHAPSVYAFTEQGVAMLSGLLNSPRAIAVNIEIMRAFVRLRQLIASHADLAHKLAKLEEKYETHDVLIKEVFDAIRELMTPPTPEEKRRVIGFGAHMPKPKTN